MSAENVALKALGQVRDYLDIDAPVGPYLADQRLLPLGISAWQHASPGQAMPGQDRRAAEARSWRCR